jgi:uncharacterized membrane protein YraQ (UPF0718 family)
MNTYSNGWGHLIVTLAVLVMCTTLLVLKVVAADVVMGLVGTVVAFWFLSGSSKFQQPATPDTTTPTTTPGPGGTLP